MKIAIVGQNDVKFDSIGRKNKSLIRRLWERFFARNKDPIKVQSCKSFTIINFEISIDELSFTKIFHSAFATPARYIMEIFSRLSSTDTPDEIEGIFIFNLFFELSTNKVDNVLTELKRFLNSSDIKVLCDKSGLPIGYFFPKNIPASEMRYLSLLSTIDAEIDSAYLRNAFLVSTECVCIDNNIVNKKANKNFNYNKYYERIYKWIAESAIKTLSKQYGGSLDNAGLKTINSAKIQQLKLIRDSVPFTAIMPHHAGDVLFMAIGLRNNTSHVKKVIVNDRYVDILRECAPDIKPITFSLVPTYREGILKPDEEYFWEVVPLIPEDDIENNFFYYWRPSREYRVSFFHLIDHFAFAMGMSFRSKDELLSKRPILNHYLLKKGKGPFKILLHFEGGWPLKVYPVDYQIALIDKFYSDGYESTVLTPLADNSNKYKTVKYENLSQFKELLSSHHILIGMDSFPVHYAAHIMGSPTICLFGNTKPVNSDAPISDYYLYPNQNLNCAGCFGFDSCPINGQQLCDNFPNPEEVFNATVTMLNKLYSI